MAMDIFNYLVFVILPIFVLGFQALLLPVLFFLKSRNWLQSYAFMTSGGIVGFGFGYVYANLSGLKASIVLVMLSVSAFGALSGLFWWYLLVKRLEADGDSS
jgi:hypothetical protein